MGGAESAGTGLLPPEGCLTLGDVSSVGDLLGGSDADGPGVQVATGFSSPARGACVGEMEACLPAFLRNRIVTCCSGNDEAGAIELEGWVHKRRSFARRFLTVRLLGS